MESRFSSFLFSFSSSSLNLKIPLPSELLSQSRFRSIHLPEWYIYKAEKYRWDRRKPMERGRTRLNANGNVGRSAETLRHRLINIFIASRKFRVLRKFEITNFH